MTIGVFYATNKGFAEGVARNIATKLAVNDVFDIKDTAIERMKDFDSLVLVVSTHGEGQIQRDLKAKIEEFNQLDFTGKTVALVGLGDGVEHGETFNNAQGELHDMIIAQGGVSIGSSNPSDYEYQETASIRNGQFPGLILDVCNQDDATEGRINAWLAEVKDKL